VCGGVENAGRFPIAVQLLPLLFGKFDHDILLPSILLSRVPAEQGVFGIFR